MASHMTPDSRDTALDGSVPSSRTVRSLREALSAVVRRGGSITSETRTAPGIGSWAFVIDGEGRELVLWETAGLAG
jgi:predicted enzyme related to lactoylglutathione lyase